MQRAYESLLITQWWCFWAGYYDYAEMIGVKFDESLKSVFHEFCKEIPLIYAFDGLAIICHKPQIAWKEMPHEKGKPANRILHNEKGPVIEYQDGFKVYCLNNIRVPESLVMTDAGKIDPKSALTEKNVDIQREIIRKVGAERMLKACDAKTLDTFTDRHTKGGNEYKLMEMTVGENIRRKYLYFEHASFSGVFYAHPVHPDIKRALHARAWMLGVGEVPELQSTNDSDVLAALPLEVA